MIKKFFCPVNDWDCPYWKKDGSCSMVDDGDNPVMECDDAGYFCDDPDDCFVWEDDNGNRYDVQELLEKGYHFINGEPVFDPALAPCYGNRCGDFEITACGDAGNQNQKRRRRGVKPSLNFYFHALK